jgi:hypothetical protein
MHSVFFAVSGVADLEDTALKRYLDEATGVVSQRLPGDRDHYISLDEVDAGLAIAQTLLAAAAIWISIRAEKKARQMHDALDPVLVDQLLVAAVSAGLDPALPDLQELLKVLVQSGPSVELHLANYVVVVEEVQDGEVFRVEGSRVLVRRVEHEGETRRNPSAGK